MSLPFFSVPSPILVCLNSQSLPFWEEPSWAQMGKRVGSDGCLISFFLCCLLLVPKLHRQRSCERERETEGERASKRVEAQIGKVKLVNYQVKEGL